MSEVSESAGSISVSSENFGAFFTTGSYSLLSISEPADFVLTNSREFGAFPPQVLVLHHHRLTHLIPFSQTLGTLVLFCVVAVFFYDITFCHFFFVLCLEAF